MRVRSERSGAAEPQNPEAAGNSHKGMHAYEAKSRRTCAVFKTPLAVYDINEGKGICDEPVR